MISDLKFSRAEPVHLIFSKQVSYQEDRGGEEKEKETFKLLFLQRINKHLVSAFSKTCSFLTDIYLKNTL